MSDSSTIQQALRQTPTIRELPGQGTDTGSVIDVTIPPKPANGDVLNIDFARYLDILRRRWRTGAATFLVVATGVAAGTLMRSPVYRATGLLEMRRETTGAGPVATLFGGDRVATDELQTQFGVLRSRTLADRVAAQMREVATPAAASDSLPTPGQIQRRLMVELQKGSRLIQVSFESADPTVAAAVINATLDNYLQMRLEEADRSVKLIETELQRARQKLDSSEAALRAYVGAHGLEVFETGKGEMAHELNDRLRSLSAARTGAQAERFAKQSAFEQARAGLDRGDLTGPVIENLTVRLVDLRREYAKQSAVFHDEYPAVKALKDQIAELEKALTAERQLTVARLERDYQAALQREELLGRSLERQNSVASTVARPSGGYDSLKRTVVTNQQMFALLDQRLGELRISSALKASDVGIVDRPVTPESPIRSSPVIDIVLALVSGLAMATAAILVHEYTDTTVRTPQDVGSYLGVPALAAIPALVDLPQRSSTQRRLWWRIDDPTDHQPVFADAFAALRTTVLFGPDAGVTRVVLVTSAMSMEGKTTVVTNLALSLAKLNGRALLIDANMRFPCVHILLGLRPFLGLSEYLSSDADWRPMVQAGPHKGLDVLVCGKTDANPADLLSLPRMRDLTSAAAREYDFVLIDSPALLANPADVRSLAAAADGVLVIVRQGRTPRETVWAALSQLTRVIGVVLNGANERDVPAYMRDVAAPPTAEVSSATHLPQGQRG